MKKIALFSGLSLFAFCSVAQNDETITIGKKETLYSKVLNEKRKIWIYTPGITSHHATTGKQYPVLYLLDGDAHFYSTVGIVQQFSQANGNGVLPEMIVVGIENTNRLRDFIPSSDVTKPNPFVSFLSSELIPYIDKNYNPAPYRVIVGHSLGGLTAIDILSNNPSLFNAYIAIDPSMWYNNEKFLNNTLAQFPKQNMNDRRLFIGTANSMPKGMNISQLKKDNSEETQHIRSIFKLNDYLKSNTNGLQFANKYYESERHNTVPLMSEYDGLRFVFDYYFFDATEKDFTDSTALIASRLKIHYTTVSERMGYKNTAPETLVNYLAYDALSKKHFNKAKALFELNIEWYPESSNVYDSYGDYLVAIKDTSNAITNYKRALQIKNDASTLAKLNAINKEKTFNYSIDYLKLYTGVYTLVAFNLDMKLEIRDGNLWAIVPGQPDSEILPLSENVFTIKGQQGYTITFEMNGDQPKGFTSVQPNGTFEGVFKSK
jgi:hypothetical protein